MLYTVSTKNGTRYQLDKKPVKTEDVPAEVVDALKDLPDGTQVDELGEVFDPSTETEESENEDTPDENEGSDNQDDGESDEEEDNVTDQSNGGPVPQSENGFGHKRAKGKTLSIFSNVPHETVKYINGVMVPLTHKEYAEKTDGEIITQLRKLKKIR